MKASTWIASVMVPPRVKRPQQSDRIGSLAAASLGGFAWAMTQLLRSLHWLDSRLGQRQHR